MAWFRSLTDEHIAPWLIALGLHPEQARAWSRAPGRALARVSEDRRTQYLLATQQGERLAEVRPELLRDARRGEALRPVVGDFVAYELPDEDAAADRPVVIEEVLPRLSQFVRKRARQELRQQVLSTNIDRVFLVTALDAEFNVRRIERYLALAHESGAAPVVVLTKPDLCDDVPARLAEAREVTGDVPVLVVEPRTGAGMDDVLELLEPGDTAALLGSSGVGKSTLINRLLGEERQLAGEVRKDGKGRHTTTTRQLRQLPSGALVIDTPGMRELGLWDADEGVRETFADVEAVAADCRFRDCTHRDEPGCAVREAVQAGRLDLARVEALRKLREELRDLDRDLARRKKRSRRGKPRRR